MEADDQRTDYEICNVAAMNLDLGSNPIVAYSWRALAFDSPTSRVA